MKTARSFLKLAIAECQTGFTLNEILVSINVIIIAVLSYSLSTVGVIRGNMTNDNTTVAINLAQDKLEQLKAQKKLVNENRCPSSGDSAITAAGMAGGIFNRCWRVADSSLGAHLKQIDVRVSWRDQENREIAISTLAYAE